MANTGDSGWGLEVARGREVGRVFALGPGSSVLGNGLNGEPGIDLGVQEGASPRKMAARQALVRVEGGALLVRDLDSPGGTFVNRQRLLAGQDRRLEPGDLIQLGPVHLLVVAPGAGAAPALAPPPTARPAPVPTARPAPPPPPPPPPAIAPAIKPAPARSATAPAAPAPTARPGGLPTPFTMASGVACRTWDDFLTASAKSWSALREELTSGRLGSFLLASGRDDLTPPAGTSKPPDERLDEWLGRLPTTRPAHPDLDVHPAVVRIRAVPGGGLTRAKIVITNTGYRLLRTSLRVEPASAGWVHVGREFAAGPFPTAETTEVPIDVEIAESLTEPMSATLVVESNGGTRRVEVRVEPAMRHDVPPDVGADETARAGTTLGEALAVRSGPVRAIFGALAAAVTRAVFVGGDRAAGLLNLETGSGPTLAGGALVLAIGGGVVAGRIVARRGGAGDIPAGVFAGAFAGVLAAALGVSACRAIEPAAGLSGSGWAIAPCVLWAVLGACVGIGSLVVVPYTPSGENS